MNYTLWNGESNIAFLHCLVSDDKPTGTAPTPWLWISKFPLWDSRALMVTHETYILLTTALQQQVISSDSSGPHQPLERLLQL